MVVDKTSEEVLKASAVGFVGILVLAAILMLLDIGSQLAKGQPWEAILSFLSVSQRDSAPWAFLAGGFAAGLYIRSLHPKPILTSTFLANIYIFVLSLAFHATVTTPDLSLLITQVRTLVIGLLVFGISMSLGALLELEKERLGIRG
jgi:hypothetical protein